MGTYDGAEEGADVGPDDGTAVVGSGDGTAVVGKLVGTGVGSDVVGAGELVGLEVGTPDGACDGAGVGSIVGHVHSDDAPANKKMRPPPLPEHVGHTTSKRSLNELRDFANASMTVLSRWLTGKPSASAAHCSAEKHSSQDTLRSRRVGSSGSSQP